MENSRNSSYCRCHTRNKNFVYMKVHKAASSLMNQILLRYGITKNKTLVLPQKEHYFHFTQHFTRKMIFDYLEPKLSPYQMLINHARYNRSEMDAVVPDALYFATLREPVHQFESSFGFWQVSEVVAGQEHPTAEAMELFFTDPKRYMKSIPFGFTLWNCQIFDLGLDSRFFNNEKEVGQKIQQLDEEFDLVLITEYIDESLVLLKNILCLDFTDILYLPANVRSDQLRTDITRNLSLKIKEWNSADVLLYDHFNRTLWKKIRNQGPEFYQDLQTYRQLKEEVYTKCVNYTDGDVNKRTHTMKLNFEAGSFCKALAARTVQFVNNFRQSIEQERKKGDSSASDWRKSLNALARKLYFDVNLADKFAYENFTANIRNWLATT